MFSTFFFLSITLMSQVQVLNSDFGTVKEGVEINHSVVVYNKNIEQIEIVKVETTCGCTVVNQKKNWIIKPKGKLKINFKIFTSNKIGKFQKSVKVYSSASKVPIRFLLTGNVKEIINPLLKEKSHKNKSVSLFSNKCASCHVKPGIGKLGQELYFASCATCHGVLREGRGAVPALSKEVMLSKKVGDLYNSIIYGGKPHGVMPGFGEKSGGPLTRDQVSSLVTFLEKGFEKNTNEKLSLFYQGQQLYKQFCSSCHGKNRDGMIGPSLKGELLKGISREKLNQLLTDGIEGTIMPAYSIEKGGLLTEFEIKLITAFLKNSRD